MSLLFSSWASRTLRPIVSATLAQQQHQQPSCYHLLTALRFKGGPKTNSGVKKRFRLRGSGSIKRNKSGRSHNTGYKHRQRVNRLGSSTGIEGTKIEQRIRKMLGCFNA